MNGRGKEVSNSDKLMKATVFRKSLVLHPGDPMVLYGHYKDIRKMLKEFTPA